MLKVVGTIFLKDNKLLIDKPRTKPTHQMIGGKVEEKETPLQAAIRECYEELGPKAIFDESKFEPIKNTDLLIGEATYGDRPDLKTGVKERKNDLDKLKSKIMSINTNPKRFFQQQRKGE